jgi:hypothetical protein
LVFIEGIMKGEKSGEEQEKLGAPGAEVETLFPKPVFAAN